MELETTRELADLYAEYLEISKKIEKKVNEYVKNFKEGDTISCEGIVIDKIQRTSHPSLDGNLFKAHLNEGGWMFLKPLSLASYIVSSNNH